ncbi:hypothetical protein PR202_ga06584 [Eleusine coracana subsp. coracana]|uniref:K-box domain-containing protein n=1 Tax=Eleusine coracana subsp. coracana TaxID=191504 RepID=A0AAV5BWF5_ELECO|nr:hypothetical protein PR202_ga06584 [Eleusine coracana subsp. coracana]
MPSPSSQASKQPAIAIQCARARVSAWLSCHKRQASLSILLLVATARTCRDRLRELIEQYQHTTNNRFEEINHDQQIFMEMTRMKDEVDKLETGIRRYTGDDLSSLTLSDVNDLEQQLEFSVNKVRTRKHELLSQQLDNLRRKEHILEDQNSALCRMINENQQDMAVGRRDLKLTEMPLAMLPPSAFGQAAAAYYGGESSSSTALQLMSAAPQLHHGGFRLQPTQPNLQDLHHGHHGLQLW